MKFVILTCAAFGVLISCRVKLEKPNIPGQTDSKDDVRSGGEEGASATEEILDVKAMFEKVMKYPYEQNLKQLPVSGQAKSVPYSGYYYFEKLGGTDENGALSKYDRVFGTKASAWERKNHYTSPSSPDAEWSGHCNGLGAAASRLAEPPADVTRNGEVFTRKDIKALLAEIHMSIYNVNLGGKRCTSSGSVASPFERDKSNTDKMNECEDVNPGSFLVALGNTVGGRDRLSVLYDQSADKQVWNYAIYAYECLNCQNGSWLKLKDIKAAKEIIWGQPYAFQNTYQFNPKATNWYDVVLKVTYSNGSSTGEILDRKLPESKNYRFVIETDDDGQVLGGEWAAANRNNHPDAINLTLQAGRGSGDRRFSNPELDPEVVMDIWRESMRNGGVEFPYEGKMYPYWEDLWSTQTDYTLEIDGLKSGVVSVADKNKLKITLKGKKLRGAKLTLNVNDEIVDTGSMSGDSEVFELKFAPGSNTLVLSFVNGGQAQEDRFEVYGMY